MLRATLTAIVTLLITFTASTAFTQSRAETGIGTENVLVPDYARLQYAGEFGMLSAGPGWSFLNRRLELDTTYGFTPVHEGHIHQVNVEPALNAIDLHLSGALTLHLLRLGGFLSYHFGQDFFFREHRQPGSYEKQNRVAFGPHLGSSLLIRLKKSEFVSGMDLFWRASASRLALRYWRENSEVVGPLEVVSIGFGLRLFF